MLKKTEIAKIFSVFEQLNPKPTTELEYVNDFTLLVAVVLSAQSTDAGVNKATRTLFKIADTPDKMLALGESGLKEYIKTIGLFNAKARNIMALCRKLIDDFGGNIPRTREELTSLPGVGRKTANVILNTAFGEHTIAVDTHVFRVANRIGIAIGNTPEQVEAGLEENIPVRFKEHAHHWLILHGRYVCVARKPKCEACPISKYCEFIKKFNR